MRSDSPQHLMKKPAQGGKEVTKFTIEEVTVNIADTRGNRFVRAGVYFEAAPAVLEELEANRARMVDTLGQVLSTKTLDDLTSPNIRGNLAGRVARHHQSHAQGRAVLIMFTLPICSCSKICHDLMSATDTC